jgi:hypothetical protein
MARTTRQQVEDRVLTLEARLNPGDKSKEAAQIRATAESIRGHRGSGK